MNKGGATYYRGEMQILESCIFPNVGVFLGQAVEQSVRHRAIFAVLRRLPEEPFRQLEEKIDEFQWFIPHDQVRAMVQPFPVNIPAEESIKGRLTLATYAKVLYLSPTLERSAWDIAVAIVAHELAHIILGHIVTGVDDADYETQEDEVYDAVSKWGFEREAEKHRALCRWRSTREQRAEKRLKVEYEAGLQA